MLRNINSQKYFLPFLVFFFSFLLLIPLQVKLSNPILLLERFFKGAGWIEIFFISCYGALIAYKMQDKANVPKWRKLTWIVFSIVFFSQLIIGISGAEKFLMTGQLHLPIPAMVISGPLYRGHLSVMTILFLSTLVLTGPAWCSQLCYFGAFDSLAAGGRKKPGHNHEFISSTRKKTSIKFTIVFFVIAVTLLLKWFKVPTLTATLVAIAFGLTGIVIMIFVSRKNGKMVHCAVYCPLGSLVNVMKYINPFRIRIDKSCTLCMKCTVYCKYDALNKMDVKNKKPSYSCTYCGDCFAGCKDGALQYHFPGLKPKSARNLYLLLTITLHVVFLAAARI
jgi:polyferredoxin